MVLYTKADSLYDVTVSVTVVYRYYSLSTVGVPDYNEFEGESNGQSQTQKLPVCASSPQDAREKAMEQCSNMCRGEQDMGYATFNGKKCKKTMVREVYDATPTLRPGSSC